MNGDSYVVRIYKRGTRPAASLVGIVENTASGERSSFHDVDELWAILGRRAGRRKASAESASPKKRKPPSLCGG